MMMEESDHKGPRTQAAQHVDAGTARWDVKAGSASEASGPGRREIDGKKCVESRSERLGGLCLGHGEGKAGAWEE